MPEKIPTNKARQGGWGYQVLMVLVIALALAGAVWLGLEFYGEAIDTDSIEQPGGVQPDAAQPAP
jgi:hypothetical protein